MDEALDTSQFQTIRDISEEIIDTGDSSEHSDSDVEMKTVPLTVSPTKNRSPSPTFNLKTETVVELSGGRVYKKSILHLTIVAHISYLLLSDNLVHQ